MHPFRVFVEQYTPLTDDEWAIINASAGHRELTRQATYLRPGQVNGEFVFIESGTLRVFQNTPDGREHTAWLAVSGQSFCDLASFRQQQPTRFTVQALDDSRLITIAFAQMQYLYQTLPVWQEFGRKHWEDVNVRLIDTILSFQADSAQVRYERMGQERTLLQSAPLRYIAEFLGITPHTLSRLRRKR